MANDLESTIHRFVEEVAEGAAGKVHSIVLYGSGAGDQYLPGRSDLNFLIVAELIDLPLLEGLQKRTGRWAKRRIATPLVVSKSFLTTSTDSYPLEILGMMACYRVLSGSDPLDDLSPDREHVRLQVEREVKSKTLALRRGYMESCGKHQRLLDCLIELLPALDAIVRGILYMRDLDWKRSGSSLHAGSVELLGVDADTLGAIRAIRSGEKIPNRRKTIDLFGKTLEMMTHLAGVLLE